MAITACSADYLYETKWKTTEHPRPVTNGSSYAPSNSDPSRSTASNSHPADALQTVHDDAGDIDGGDLPTRRRRIAHCGGTVRHAKPACRQSAPHSNARYCITNIQISSAEAHPKYKASELLPPLSSQTASSPPPPPFASHPS